MSDTQRTDRSRPFGFDALLIAGICLIVIGAGWYLLSQRQQSLRQSPSGLDGLQIWLQSNGVSAQSFTGGWLMDETAIGLMIIPLYDTALDQESQYPASKEELLLQQDEYDLSLDPITEKSGRVPSLVVLPKWRSGMRLTGLAHPYLRAERARLTETLRKITGNDEAALQYASVPFTEFRYQAEDDGALYANIYAAQTFTAEGCEPVLGTREAMLLGECPTISQDGDLSETLVLSDPDLLNNHGLRLGDNARIILDLVRRNAGEKNVVIDYSRSTWLRDPVSAPTRERTWGDLLRFFSPPFLTLWAGAAILLIMSLWRAALRYGPIVSDLAATGSGKLTAVRARARLMRLSGQDGDLIREYSAARIAASANTLFGPAHAGHYSGESEFLKYAERRHPEVAGRLRAVLSDIAALPAHLPAAAAARHVDELEQVLEIIIHDT
ncbi:hypothetical protein FMN50_14595 [Rhodobacterales bacterium]|nr:hypothetical protein FMN50_14595 [Rhodobacterales bacterium]